MTHLGYQKKIPPFEIYTMEITIQESSVVCRFGVSKKGTLNDCVLSSKFRYLRDPAKGTFFSS